jgi:hypothetical protein
MRRPSDLPAPFDDGEPPSHERLADEGDRATAVPDFDPRDYARSSEAKLAFPGAAADGLTLEARFSCFATMQSVPWAVLPFSEIRALPLDPRSAFILQLVDGISTVEVLLDVCGVPRDEFLSILIDLMAMGAIEFH